MKKLNLKVSITPCMYGYVENSHKANHLAKTYDELYNFVPSDEDTMGRIKITTSVSIVNNVKNMILW